MYTDALEFLEEERDAWAPFEALIDLSDEALERPVESDGPNHGWRARDLLAHLVAWQDLSLRAARELAVNDISPTVAEVRRRWDAGSEAFNEAMLADWRDLPLDELRRRAREVSGELRGHLTVVPETRWLKHPDHMRFFADNMVDHYADHESDLAAVLDAARRPPSERA